MITQRQCFQLALSISLTNQLQMYAGGVHF